MTDAPYKDLVRAANDNCDNLSVSRARAMAHVRALCAALKWEGERKGPGLLRATMQVIAEAESWLEDPIGIELPRLPHGYGVRTDDAGIVHWSTPDGFEVAASTDAVAAIKCWGHYAMQQEQKPRFDEKA